MSIMVEKEKWILYKHTNNFEMIKEVAKIIHANRTDISKKKRMSIQDQLAQHDQYTGRDSGSTDSISHRINTLQYYMFGYKEKLDNEERFMFSPLGNLFLNNIDNKSKIEKIFTTMLFGIQFQHPGSGTSPEFQLYPFRLIFQLLCDKRLNGKLYNYEVEMLVVFCKSMDEDKYEQLVSKITALRDKEKSEIATILKSDEHTFVNTVYEWEYYTQKLLLSSGVIKSNPGEKIVKLYHPQKINSNSEPTGRTATTGYIEIADDNLIFVKQMLQAYPYNEQPRLLNDKERLRIDVIKEIYNFYPSELLVAIGDTVDIRVSDLLSLPKQIEEYSNNPDSNKAELFEKVLTEGFRLFKNIRANRISGAGNTDIECLYIDLKEKFAVEAKSTANKLMGINTSRLKAHREKIGAKYTIVVTSRYVPAARMDIVGQNIVLLQASTFAEYLYNHIFYDERNIDYGEFNNIIKSNQGCDISQLVSQTTISKFAI